MTDINEARDATEQQAVDARTNADQRKRAADEAAEKRTAAATKRADEAAAQRKEAAEAAKRQEEAKIRAAEQRATNINIGDPIERQMILRDARRGAAAINALKLSRGRYARRRGLTVTT